MSANSASFLEPIGGAVSGTGGVVVSFVESEGKVQMLLDEQRRPGKPSRWLALGY
jgi:hypothetical protein